MNVKIGKPHIFIPYDALQKAVDEWAPSPLKVLGDAIRDEAKARLSAQTSVKTANLINGIVSKPSTRYMGEWYVGSMAPHTRFIEYGHFIVPRSLGKKHKYRIKYRRGMRVSMGHVPARPFFFPAVKHVESNIEKYLANTDNFYFRV